MKQDYPTEKILDRIRQWPDTDCRGCLEFIREQWSDPDYFSTDDGGRTYRFSTVGWSGHEDLLCALKQNNMIWALTWLESRRGGYYVFEVPDYQDHPV